MKYNRALVIDIEGRSGNLRRLAYLLVALGAGLLATLLLIGGVQASGPSSVQATMSPLLSTTAHDGGGDDDEDEHEIHGQLLSDVTAFVGEWVLVIDNAQQITVVLTVSTEVQKFKNQLPVPGDWLEAEGRVLPDGRLEARKVRPDDFEANQVIVRLKAGADPAALAASYEMTMSAVLSSANIFLFTTTDDEESEAGALSTDPRVEWAEINWVSRVPTGDPYRTWKWGETDASGYTNQHAFAQVNLGPALDKVTGAGVTVAILDTGLDLEHPVFATQLTLLPNSNMISDTSSPDDVGPGLRGDTAHTWPALFTALRPTPR
jgi:thermitase